MRPTLMLTLLAVAGCGDGAHSRGQSIVACTGSDVPIYTSRFSPAAGASGVATPSDAEAGQTSSDPAATGAAVSAPASSDTTAMTVACGSANCGAGQVAVEVPPMAPAGGGGGLSEGEGDTASPPAGAPSDVPAGAPSGGSAQATIVCTDPPPDCPPGQSPQFTVKGTWECTDCTLVVTYGGSFGNFRRCVGAPHLNCTNGDVPTWQFEDEQWECKPECDNGAYDRHSIGDTIVCVPC